MLKEGDRIGDTFRGKTVFISGATGFLGKVLVEKLLRVTEVKKLYLLIRQKKGRTPKDRVHDMFSHVLFSKLKQERPDSIKKCVAIAGDVTEVDLGISEGDRKDLQHDTNFIFHSAATTRFDNPLKYAIHMNTRGTKYMLDLAKQCENLQLFIHVSTAFAFPKQDVLYEKPYNPPADPNKILNSVDWLNDHAVSEVTKKFLGDSPNTYTYSKALAEGLVNEEFGKLPIIIVRPAVVIPTWKEPIPGFFNNLQSPMGLFVGGGKGIIRSMYVNSNSYAKVVPADSTINVMLIAVWDHVTLKKQNVYNICVPEEDIKLTWNEIINLGEEVIHNRIPFNGIIWYPGGMLTKNKLLHTINVLFFQIIPAIFIDILLFCLGNKPILFEINQRLRNGQEILMYYTNKAWNFNTDYSLGMRRKLNAKEKQLYNIDAEDVDIKEYLTDCILYTRRHILKETDDMLPAAKRNMKIFFVLDRIVKVGFFLLLFYYISRLF